MIQQNVIYQSIHFSSCNNSYKTQKTAKNWELTFYSVFSSAAILISYSSYKKKVKEKQEKDLRNEILILEEKVDEGSIQILENKKCELENIRKEKIKGKIIRSRIQWVEEGEKPTSYFCGLESKNFTNKIIPKVEKENGDVISKQKDILKEVKSFYENLYKNKDKSKGDKFSKLKEGLKDIKLKKLTDDEKKNLEGEITIEEAGLILKNMKNNKTPGSDGFSTEFFKFFWKDLKIFVVNSLNYSTEIGELSVTQKQGIIICLPKGNKPRHFLKNWRPISLLNTVYKIGSGVIAKRFKTVLDKLIDFDQTGFISGRYIGENLRLIYDIMQFTEEKDIPGLLLLIDFEKAFDSISWEFLTSVLKLFNFGESIINWVKVFYNNIKSAVNQGGHLSEFFSIERGCRQGDPLSPYIFILCAEILALKIRNNDKINGITITQVEHKLSQFADDTSLILDGKEESLNEALNELDWFGNISGLNINFSKTQVIWIGNKKYSNEVLCQNRNLTWGETCFKVLGISFDVNLDRIVKINYDEKIVQIKCVIRQWSKRNLTVIGRITVVKTLILPILNHLFISLPNPSDDILKNVIQLMYNFIWSSPIDRIKRDVLQNDIEDGGLKMINLSAFILALKCTWIRRLFKTDNKWQNVFLSNVHVELEKFYGCGSVYIQKLQQHIKNKFWQDVLKAWQLLREKDEYDSWECFLASPIWLNNNIKVANKPIFYKDWFENGIRFINDIVNEDGTFFSHQKIEEMYQINVNFMRYNSIISAIHQASKSFVGKNHKLELPLIPSAIKRLVKSSKGSKDMYIVLNKNGSVPTSQLRWTEIFGFDQNHWKKIYKLPFVVTNNTKLQWLQYRFNHRILATNKFLHKIKIYDNPNCTFCNREIETLEHLFWECEHTQLLLEQIENWFLTNGISVLFTKEVFLFGNTAKISKGNAENTLFLTIKQYIYNSRCFKKKLTINSVKEKMKYVYAMDKNIAMKNKCEHQFLREWNAFDILLSMLS